MSFLDEQKRARRGAKALLQLLKEKENFEKNLDAYTAADGIIDGDFLKTLDRARPLLSELDQSSFLADLEELPPGFQEALLTHLVECERYDKLLEVRDGATRKLLIKSAKQRLHILKSKRITVESPSPKSWTLSAEREEAKAFCAAGAYNHVGERLILLTEGRRDGAKILKVLESDRRGVIRFSGTRVSRSGAKAIYKEVREFIGDTHTDILPGEAYWLIQRAIQVNQKEGSEPPPGFVTALSSMSRPENVPDRHPFFGMVRPIELESPEGRLKDSSKLFAHPYPGSWSVDRFFSREYMERIKKLAPTKEAFSDEGVQERVWEIIEELVDAYFGDSAVRRGFSNRLLDMAWFCAAGDENDTALVAYATAHCLTDPKTQPRRIPFCIELVARMFPLKRPSLGPDNS